MAAGGLSQEQPPEPPQSSEVEHRHKLSRDEFLRNTIQQIAPVIITGMMDDWPAMRKWDLDYFERQFGDRVVEVQMGRTGGGELRNSSREIYPQDPVRRFCREVRTAGRTNILTSPPTTAQPTERSCPSYGTISCRCPNTSLRTSQGGFSGWARPARSRRSIMI